MLFNNKKIIVITILTLFVGLISLTVFVAINSYQESIKNKIIIDNKDKYSNGINSQVFSNISSAAYSITSYNIKNAENNYHGIIRNNTFNNIPKKSISFILDIPSLKMSWSISQAIDNDGKPISDTSVKCVNKDQIIYQSSTVCIDKSSGGKTAEQIEFLKIAKILPLSGLNYKIIYDKANNKSGYKLIITYYSEAGKKEALDAITSLGYNPASYEIAYINRS